MIVDQDIRGHKEVKRLEPTVKIGQKLDQTTWINTSLPTSLKEKLLTILRKNADLLAWTAANIPGIDLEFMSHQLAIFPRAQPVTYKGRKMSLDRALEVQKQVQTLLDTGFICKAIYPTWLSNVVMVKKSNGKWLNCVTLHRHQ